MFKDIKQFKENLRILINHETTILSNYSPKTIKELEQQIENDIVNFINDLIKSGRIANYLDYFYKH